MKVAKCDRVPEGITDCKKMGYDWLGGQLQAAATGAGGRATIVNLILQQHANVRVAGMQAKCD